MGGKVGDEERERNVASCRELIRCYLDSLVRYQDVCETAEQPDEIVKELAEGILPTPMPVVRTKVLLHALRGGIASSARKARAALKLSLR